MNLWAKPKAKSHRTRLGDLLVEYGANQNKIDAASETYYDRNRFGMYCIEQRVCTQEQLSLALSRQAAERGDYYEANRIVTTTIETIHKTVLEHLRQFRMQMASLISW
jgi:hypothetical protein